MNDCPLCEAVKTNCIKDFGTWVVIKDKYPSAKIHYLIVYKGHKAGMSDLASHQMNDGITAVALWVTMTKLHSYRVAWNHGDLQSIPHMHIHITSNEDNQV